MEIEQVIVSDQDDGEHVEFANLPKSVTLLDESIGQPKCEEWARQRIRPIAESGWSFIKISGRDEIVHRNSERTLRKISPSETRE